MRYLLAEAKSRVYWNVDDFPIPEGLNPEKNSERIKSCLAKSGFNGEVSIWAYCQKSDDSLYWSYADAGIFLKERVSGVQFAEVDNMLVDILLWTLYNREEPLNYFLLSKNISAELFGVLQDLDSEKENYQFFVATPADSLSFSEIPFIQGNAVDQSGSSDEAKTGVFWNVEDCPIPEGLDPNKIYENVKSALSNQGSHCFSMWGYCEKNDLSLPGVTMVPAGDESSRFKKMLRDLLFWALRNPVDYPKTVPNLMLISRSSGFVDVLHRLISMDYNVLLALPDAVEYVSSFWLFPSLTGRGYAVVDQSESSHCVLNKGKKRTRSERRKRARSVRRRRLTLNSVLIGKRFSDSMVLRMKIQKQSMSERKKLRRRFRKKATKANYKAAKTGVFWSINPDCLTLDRVDLKIKSALEKQGYNGDMSIKGYWDHRRGSCYWVGLFIPVVYRVSEGPLSVEVDNMFCDIVLWALENPAPSNLMVISENISEETEEVLSLLHTLKQRGYNVLLSTAKTILWGEEPTFLDLPNLGKTLYSKSHDADTFLFWNIEDCPIPGGLDPCAFLQNIKSALANFGCPGDVSITAYRDKNRSLDNFDNITLVRTEGDKYARIKRMLDDIFFWALENPKPSRFMVITSGIPDNVCDALYALKSRGYEFLYADPPTVVYAKSVWLSTKLLGGGSPIGPTRFCA